jgi:hypothetical protein
MKVREDKNGHRWVKDEESGLWEARQIRFRSENQFDCPTLKKFACGCDTTSDCPWLQRINPARNLSLPRKELEAAFGPTTKVKL